MLCCIDTEAWCVQRRRTRRGSGLVEPRQGECKKKHERTVGWRGVRGGGKGPPGCTQARVYRVHPFLSCMHAIFFHKEHKGACMQYFVTRVHAHVQPGGPYSTRTPSISPFFHSCMHANFFAHRPLTEEERNAIEETKAKDAARKRESRNPER